MYHLILVILRENDSLVRPQRIFSLSPHRLPLLQRERTEKKTLLHTHTCKGGNCVFATTGRPLINMLLTSQSTLEGACGQFFSQDGKTANQARAQQSRSSAIRTRTHTHSRPPYSGLTLPPHPDLLVHFGGGRPNSFKRGSEPTAQPAFWVEDSRKPDADRNIFDGTPRSHRV